MNGAELKTFTESIMDDNIDETFFYQVLNIVKTIREESRPWEYLKKLDSSISVTSGQTYTTSRALQDDFARPYRLYLVDSNKNQDELFGVPFEDQHLHNDTYGYFWIDVANDLMYLTGTQTKDTTLYHYYIKKTDEITSSTSPVFPSRFHAILGFDVAAYLMGGVDADTMYEVMSDKNKLIAEQLSMAMEDWDDQLKMKAINHSLQPRYKDLTIDPYRIHAE